MLVEKCGWAIQKSLFAQTNQDSTFYHIRENSKMFNIPSKYFSFFSNKSSWKLCHPWNKGFFHMLFRFVLQFHELKFSRLAEFCRCQTQKWDNQKIQRERFEIQSPGRVPFKRYSSKFTRKDMCHRLFLLKFFSYEKIFKSTFFQRTPPVAASGNKRSTKIHLKYMKRQTWNNVLSNKVKIRKKKQTRNSKRIVSYPRIN